MSYMCKNTIRIGPLNTIGTINILLYKNIWYIICIQLNNNINKSQVSVLNV